VITIIILLILASISITTLFGQDGIITRAQDAARKTKEASENEQEMLNYATGYIANILNGTGAEGGTPSDTSKDPSEEIIGDGSYVEVNGEEACSPKLADGMEAIVINPDGSDRPATSEEDWYDYSTNKWANARTTDGSYWVWIPRYEYKIDYTGVEQGINTDETKAGTIEVSFIDTSTKAGAAGYTTTNGITRSADEYIIHPAFTDNVDAGGWDNEIPGFWVAKYEMSMEDGSGTHVEILYIGNVATEKTLLANGQSGNGIKTVSKPRVSSWVSIKIANAYENSFNYDREKESHLMKNSEWGAVAYLTHSKYGRNGTEVTINNSGARITGNAGDTVSASSFSGTFFYNTLAGMKASTTGNISGIYDLSGGSDEHVATYNKAYSRTGDYFGGAGGNTSGYSPVVGSHFAFNIHGTSTKYVTAYTNSTTIYSATTLSDFTSGGKDVSHIGDGIHEVWVASQYSWFSDSVGFVTSNEPFFDRGRLCL